MDERGNTKLDKPMWIQPKVDGIRNIMILSDNPQALSRNAKTNFNCEEMLATLSEFASGYVIDGELFAGSFGKTITAVKTRNYKSDDLIFYSFDIIPLSEFINKTCSMRLKERDKLLNEIIAKCNHPKIKCLAYEEVYSNGDIVKITKRYIQEGYEGSIIKNPDSLYGYLRSNGWYKFKPFETYDYKIVRLLEGGGRLKGRLGSLVIDVDGIQSSVGTGFTDEQGTVFWNLKNQLIGKYVEVKFQRKNSSGSLRHTVFVRLRDDN